MSSLRTQSFLFVRTVPISPAKTTATPRLPLVLVGAIILFSLLGRIWFLTQQTWLQLAPDEAHYWDWSRHLDWSYYSKGPLVAWLIRASCWLTGQEAEWAIRLPAALCGAFTLTGLAVLTQRIYQRPWWTLALVCVASLLPLLVVGSLLMTIDAPYVCCWTWAMVVAHGLMFPTSASAQSTARSCLGWLLLGVIIGLGILAKYTMALFIPSMALFLFTVPQLHSLAIGKKFMAMLGVVSLCCLPILVWNAQHDWATFHHVGGQAGLNEEFGQASRWYWLGPLEFIGGQLALMLGVGFVFWILATCQALRQTWAVIRFGSTSPTQSTTELHERFLLCYSVPMFLVFLGFSIKTKVQLNWPIAAYLPGLVLTLAWLMRQWQTPRRWQRWSLRIGLAWLLLLGGGLSVLLHRTEWLYPVMQSWQDRWPARRWDPSFRLRGASTLADAVATLRQQLRAQGIEPVLAGTTWNVPGLLGFYLFDHPNVVCMGALGGDRPSQYDYWPPQPNHQPDAFHGRTFIIVGYPTPSLLRAFERMEDSKVIRHEIDGQLVNSWVVTVAHGFRGPR